MAVSNFINPLIINAEKSISTFALSHTPNGIPLIDQIFEKISPNVIRIGIIGAFFDKDLAFIEEISKRWPKSQLVVGIDPETVQMIAVPTNGNARYVDIRKLWPEQKGYLHAKMIWFDTSDENSAFVSGSSNPSRPAWMGPSNSSNVEAVLLRLGRDADHAVESIGLTGIFKLEVLDPELFKLIVKRSVEEINTTESPPIPLWSGVSVAESDQIKIGMRGSKVAIDYVAFFNADMNAIGELVSPHVIEDDVVITSKGDIANIRSGMLYFQGVLVARAMIHHPNLLLASLQSSRQNQIRNALNGLGASEGDISKLITSVERVIFSDETHREAESAIRGRKETQETKGHAVVPESLEVSVAELAKEKKKLRLLKSGDLAYLLDVLLRNLSEQMKSPALGLDLAGLTEEERVGTEGGEVMPPSESALPPTELSDFEVAKAVSSRSKSLIKKMMNLLESACTDHKRRGPAVLQLFAVIALVRELRHLDKTPRWKSTGQHLVEQKDRRYLLDESLKYLLGSNTKMLEEIDSAEANTEEGAQLRVLLLWLAWDLGEELTDTLGRIWENSEFLAKIRANAMFLKLIPPILKDTIACSGLELSLSRTVQQNPEAALRAANWLREHLNFGAIWARGFCDDSTLRVGGYCRVPGVIDEPRVVIKLDSTTVDFWDYDGSRTFNRDRVKAVIPTS